MTYLIDIQHATKEPIHINDETLEAWAICALEGNIDSAELTLRIVDEDEIHSLNHLYRKQDKPTNVLAFEATVPEDIQLDYPLLGDVVICASVLKKESEEQQKALDAHWAHIVIHGVLHLLGYDHIEEDDAKIMQALEIKLLASLGIDDPYQLEDDKLE